MKKYVIFCLALAFLSFMNVNAQSFEKGNVNVDLGIGFGVYGTSQKINQKISAAGVTVQDTSFSETDGAVSLVILISFEYGISDKIGLGADLIINNYIIAEEDKADISSVKAFDFGVKFNYHILNSDKNELFFGLGLGFSSINWDLEPNPLQIIESYSGSGVYWSIGVTDRIFFSDHVGILFNLSYKGYSYSGLEAEFTPEGEVLINSFGVDLKQEIDWTFNGVNLGVGLALKF